MYAIQNEFFEQVEIVIDEIKRNTINPIAVTKKIVEILGEKINELREVLYSYQFTSIEEEIYFFKEQKPRLIAKLIYYNLILEIEANMPITKRDKMEFIEMMLNEISLFTQRNKVFYQYYRSKATYNDEKYFTRFKYGKLDYYTSNIVNYDIRFCTSHDFNVSQFMANEMIADYLEDKLAHLNSKSPSKAMTSNLKWTGSRVDLVELIYALQSQQVFNHGDIDIKELAHFFSLMFNINIEDGIYRNYIDIKARKNDRTKFLRALAESLNSKIKEEEA